MQIFENLSSFKKVYAGCVATIGKYDGMHLGHQEILTQVKGLAKAKGLPSLVILSEPQPEEFFMGEKAPIRLNHFNDKVRFLKDFGIDAVYQMNFNHQLSQVSAEEFINDVLVTGLGIKALVVGDDFRFGKNRLGDFALLKQEGESSGFSVESIKAYFIQDKRISSTLVRELLTLGQCDEVKALLGQYYQISGEVVLGKQLGRQLGTPTANLKINALPLRGVFAVQVELNGNMYQGVANIGYRPTIDDVMQPSLEVHLFNFSEDIYGKSLRVSFVEKIRDEIKFSGLDELKQQIAKDIEQAKSVFK